MATLPEEMQVGPEKAQAIIIPFLRERNETIDQHITTAVTHYDPSTQLLFSSKSSTHLPAAGLNPLIDSAAHLFFLMGKLKRIKEHNNLAKLHDELVKEVHEFQERVHTSRYSKNAIAEYIPITTYALCIALDDIIAETSWGGQGKWKRHSIVTAIFSETASQKSFYIILERLIIDPTLYIDAVEFLYICLSFGLKCRDDAESQEFSHDQHGQISNFLYRFIQAYRGNFSKVLSPFPIRSQQVKDTSKFNLMDIIESISESSLSWINKLISFKSKPKSDDFQSPNNLLMKSMHSLQNRVNSASNFIKKTKVTKNGKQIQIDNFPWYFLIGSSDSGKTSLLQKSNINFILGKKEKRNNGRVMSENTSTPASFDWWITPNAVLVDVPGDCMKAKDKNFIMGDELWQHFLALIQKKQGRKKLGGIIIAISVTELFDKQCRNQLTNNLKCRIQDIQRTFGKDVSFYFTITKMDLLPGFMDFFDDCSIEELMQAWGITMPELSATDSVSSVFINRFNALIKILNNQIIQRLHQERNFYTKSNIKDFPLYVERVKDEFAGILNALRAHTDDFCLKGIYLTSALQDGLVNQEAAHPETMVLPNSSEKMLEMMSVPDKKQAPYFIKQFILQGIRQ